MDLAAVRKGVASGFAWQGLTKLTVQFASWGSTLFVARLIAPADYGLVAAAAIFTELLIVLTELGLAQGLIQRPEITRRELDGAFFTSLGVGLAAYAVLFLLAPAIAGFYDMALLTDIIRLSAVGVILGSLKSVPLAIAMRRMDFRYRSLVEMGSSVTMMLTVVVLALKGYGVWSLVWGPIIGNLVVVCAYLPLLGHVPRLGFSRHDVAGPLNFGLKLTGTSLLYFIWSRADVAIIGKVLGERALGIYSMAFQLAVLPLDKIGSIFNQVLFPALARLQHDLRASQELFVQQHRNLLLVSYPLVFGLAVVAEDAVRVLLTERWLPIVPYLQVLCVISALRVSGMMMPAALYARGKPGRVVRYSVLATVLLPAAMLVGVQIGIEGVVLGWAVVYPILYLVLGNYCLTDLELGWWDLLRPVLPVLGASLAMIVVVLAFQHLLAGAGAAWRLGGAIMLGGALYVGLILLAYRPRLSVIRSFVPGFRRGEAMK